MFRHHHDNNPNPNTNSNSNSNPLHYPIIDNTGLVGRKIERKKIESHLRKIERELANSLLTYRGSSNNNNNNSGQSYLNISNANNMETKRMIREAVIEVYKLGIEYVCSYFALKPFLQAHDFAPIGKITDDVFRTWMYGGRLESAMIHLTTVTLAKATIAKSAQIVRMLNASMFTTATTATATARLTPDVTQPHNRLPVEGEILIDPPDAVKTTLYYVWITEQDNLVCPECMALDGQTWGYDDQLDDSTEDVPVPILDTHPNCRCRVDIETESEQVANL